MELRRWDEEQWQLLKPNCHRDRETPAVHEHRRHPARATIPPASHRRARKPGPRRRQTRPDATPGGKTPGKPATAAPVKKLRDLGIHAGLTKTGGTSSQDAALPVLITLAPAETARTVSDLPVLCWFSSGA